MGTRAVRPATLSVTTYAPVAALGDTCTGKSGPVESPFATCRPSPIRVRRHRTRLPPPSIEMCALSPAGTGSSGPAATVPSTVKPVPGSAWARVGGNLGGNDPVTSAGLRTVTETE